MSYYMLLVFVICLNIRTFHTRRYNDFTQESLQFPSVKGCSCEGDECKCCVFLDIPKIYLNETGCVIIKYLAEEVGVDMKFKVNSMVILDEEISLRNPPPLCEEVPYFREYASLCIKTYNVTWSQQIGGCIKLEAKLMHVLVKEVEFGCFYFHEKKNRTTISKIYQLFRNFMSVTKRVYKEENRGMASMIL
ncbi:uncharacterized protein LOC100202684 isoform X2 [Hydra vulgaris]|uniref:Uncharacterized protein LOC100202684 isoform X2 n=1 Tax=Hydra vulgaris TaxID=6087 RepID=A0ABM4B6T5_HYDVU